MAEVKPVEIDQEIVAKCVPLWRVCMARAIRGRRTDDNQKGRSEPLHSVDAELRAHGIVFGTSPYDPRNRIYRAYVNAVIKAAS